MKTATMCKSMLFLIVALTCLVGSGICSASMSAYAEEDQQGNPKVIVVADFASGSGAEDDPYIIETPEQLVSFRDSVNKGNTYEGRFIALGNDIDMSTYNWVPIGASIRSGSGMTGTSTPFAGTFDGRGNAIEALTLKPATPFSNPNYAIGLFGGLKGATVKNLNVTNADIEATGSELAGILCGLMVDNATVSQVKVSGKLSATCAAGGIAGRMTLAGTIEDCTNDASITTTGGTGNTAGIVGAAYYTTPDGKMRITRCINNGPIQGTNDVGGIAGLCCGFVESCTNTGTVVGTGYAVGGIAGEIKNYGGITASTNTAAVTTESTDANIYGTGGIVGWVRYSGTPPAYAQSANVAITDNNNSGEVAGKNDAGGIVGMAYSAIEVTGNQNTAAALSSDDFAAGIVGAVQKQTDVALPVGVSEGALVQNNVSTTSLDAIKAPNKDRYVYNNNAVPLTNTDQGTQWVAFVDGKRYTTLQQALDNAPDGGVVKLLNTAVDVPMTTIDRTGSVSLDLNNHDISFLPEGEFFVNAGSFAIIGNGSIYKPENAPDQTLIKVGPARVGTDAQAHIVGGSYSTDVARFVGKGFSELVKDQTSPIGMYQILPTDEAKSRAKASVTSHGVTVYFEKAAAAHDAGKLDPDAVVADLGSTPPDQGEVVLKPIPIEPVPMEAPVGSLLQETGDEMYIWVAVLGFVVSASCLVMGLSVLATRRKS